ncbi:multimodular transpeptidase-transglycosylase [Vibrio phage vB_VnaS-AQKL99]|nr:multimodular transpeptidase-transglycosylase [Vibrio phage vB_VnaS-AQKL99]
MLTETMNRTIANGLQQLNNETIKEGNDMAGLNFNATNVAPQQAFENLAPGWYTVKMVESEMKPTSAGTGSYLECTFEVLAPQQFAGRKLWDRLNLNNPNEKAVEIAYQTLSAMCHATGVMQVQDSQQLHNIPMDAKVGLSKPTEQYPEPRNEIKGYRACQGNGGMAPQGQGAAPQQQQWGQPAQQQQQPVQQQQQWGQQQQQAPQQQQQQQQWQQPAEQQQQQQQQWQQPAEQQQAPQQEQQQAAPWGQQTVEQQQQQAPQQQQQQVQQQEHPQQMNMQQPATDTQGQQAAQSGVAPWQQG